MGHGDVQGWRRAGDAFQVDWCGSAWRFRADDDRPGLSPVEGEGRHLALAGLAAAGRRDAAAFTPASLIGVEILHGRLLATFKPRGWHDLTVRAAWGPCREGRGMDLEVQVSTDSVGALRRLEVLAETTPAAAGWEPQGPCSVFFRDAEAETAVGDGRETPEALANMHVARPDPNAGDPRLACAHWVGETARGDVSRITLAFADDVCRWSYTGAGDWIAFRFAFFGFDLEKGVVLRGRLREVRWADGEPTAEAIHDERLAFLAEPLPLRTD